MQIDPKDRVAVRGHADDLRSNFPSDAHSNLDAVEIDRSLIRDVSGSEAATGLADAIIAIGKSLSLTVVAQGVETGEQAGFLAHTPAMSCKASIFLNGLFRQNSYEVAYGTSGGGYLHRSAREATPDSALRDQSNTLTLLSTSFSSMYPIAAGLLTTSCFTSSLVGISFGGSPLPVNMIFDQ